MSEEKKNGYGGARPAAAARRGRITKCYTYTSP